LNTEAANKLRRFNNDLREVKKQGMLRNYTKKKKICLLSTFTPQKCGIAVFTRDLVDHLDLSGELAPAKVIAVTKESALDQYGNEVFWQIRKGEEEDYAQAAIKINSSNFDLVNIQHEFGIFGGKFGSHLLSFLTKIEKPVVTSLHTVQPDFDSEALGVLKEIISLSESVVVTGRTAADILEGYGVPTEKVKVIQHGCPDVPFTSSSLFKPSLDLTGRSVLCTFGLISRGKGIEYAIQALPSIIAEHPEVLYLVIGETHPEVKISEDENYRRYLVKLVDDLELQNHVEFHNRFVPKPELIRFLQATDVYITPYLGKNQISSGTLIYALGTGRAVVSTPYLHAQEVLADGRGLFCEFKDPSSIGNAVNKLLDNNCLKSEMERKAYEYSRSFTWFEVAKKYADLFKQVINDKEEVESIEISARNA
jgi:glycosyltransferase involved in cell wall biosynthesis